MEKLSLAVVMILVATVAAYPSKPSFLGCQSSEDCGVDECCVLGMMRYSVPTCRPLGEEGDTCRPHSGDVQPQNITVTYPDGSSADLYVHTMLCPCATGLECSDGMSCTGLDGAGKLLLREDYTDVDDLNHLRR